MNRRTEKAGKKLNAEVAEEPRFAEEKRGCSQAFSGVLPGVSEQGLVVSLGIRDELLNSFAAGLGMS